MLYFDASYLVRLHTRDASQIYSHDARVLAASQYFSLKGVNII